MAMSRSSFSGRLIKPVLSSSSSFGNVFHHGSLIGMVKQFRVIHYHITEKPFSLITPRGEGIGDLAGIDEDDVVRRRWIDLENSNFTQLVRPGMVIFRKYITILGQVEIVNLCQKWGGSFYKPSTQSGADQLRPHMMCFGKNWDPVTKYEKPYRSDGFKPPRIPHQLVSLAEYAIEDTMVHPPKLPDADLDICLVNFFSTSSRLGLHQDHDESSDSLVRGVPVVSIFIGDAVEFLYGDTTDEKTLHTITLESGDVLVYGRESRLIFHGVDYIRRNSTPEPLIQATGLKSGCLNLSLKEY